MNESSPLHVQPDHTSTKKIKQETLAKARTYLYYSHLFAKGSEGIWQFCLTLFLAAFTNYQSILLVNTYGLVSTSLVCLLGGSIGSLVDKYPRLPLAQWFILLQNGIVIIATFCCFELLSLSNDLQYYSFSSKWFSLDQLVFPITPYAMMLLIGLHITGPLAGVLDTGLTVAIERDWLVVMSEAAGEQEDPKNEQIDEEEYNTKNHNDYDSILFKKKTASNDTNTHGTGKVKGCSKLRTQILQEKANRAESWLSDTNVFMKQIDLSCKVISPAIAGFFVVAFGSSSSSQSIIEVGDTSISSSSYSSTPYGLRSAAFLVGLLNVASLVVEYICTLKIYKMIPSLAIKKSQNNDPSSVCNSISENAKEEKLQKRRGTSFDIYMDQPVSLAGISMSLLYTNRLTFGPVMTAYLLWRGMRINTTGIWRGVSCTVGLLGTKAFSYLISRISLSSTGLWSISIQFLCLTVSYVSLFVQDYNLSLSLLILGVCASRIGLWTFDITVTQMMQLYVEEDARGLVGGIQQAMNAFCELLAYVIGIIYADASQFYILEGVGYFSVGVALLLYFLWTQSSNSISKLLSNGGD